MRGDVEQALIAASGVLFYVGLHQPHDAAHFTRCCISIHRLETRKAAVPCGDVLIDSGAFTKLAKYGCYPEPVEVFAGQLHRLWTQGVVRITAAVAQDYMCEPFMLARTGLTVAEHQRLTIERYDALVAALRSLFGGPPPFQVMPVLQGFTPADYISHLEAYGDRLTPGMWVGVGSVCKRQGDIAMIETLLSGIWGMRSDLRLHGFGVKLSALRSPVVRALLYSADSMAWSFSAAQKCAVRVRELSRLAGRRVPTRVARRWWRRCRGVTLPDANDWREAKRFELLTRG